MVDAGEIFAEIDASAGMVRFLEDPEQYTSSGALQHLNTTIQASFSLAQQLQAVNSQVNCLQLISMHVSSSTSYQLSMTVSNDSGLQTWVLHDWSISLTYVGADNKWLLHLPGAGVS